MNAKRPGTRDARIILLPGMGADARLFEPQRECFTKLEVPDWIEPLPRERLADYARRWAETVDPDPPFFLGGVSFGGMVALEAAKWLRPRAVFLIASCRTGSAIPRRFMVFRRFGGVLPDGVLALLRGPMVRHIARLEGLRAAHRRLLHELAAETPIGFLRWASAAIAEWSGDDDGFRRDAPIYQIHGQRDRMIPLVPAEADQVIPDGGHLINLTHADEVNRFISARTRSA